MLIEVEVIAEKGKSGQKNRMEKFASLLFAFFLSLFFAPLFCFVILRVTVNSLVISNEMETLDDAHTALADENGCNTFS